jgi:hypothetical protein
MQRRPSKIALIRCVIFVRAKLLSNGVSEAPAKPFRAYH